MNYTAFVTLMVSTGRIYNLAYDFDKFPRHTLIGCNINIAVKESVVGGIVTIIKSKWIGQKMDRVIVSKYEYISGRELDHG